MNNDSDSSPSYWLGAALVVIALIGFYRLGIVHGAQEPEDMVLVPAGEFFAGCNEEVDSECLADEKPGGPRELPAFSIDRTEVTLAAYRACVEAETCSKPDQGEGCNWGESERERHPVNCVDLDQATAYCAWRGARLPTEWEWEKAARGNDGRKYAWGNEPVDCRRAVIDEGSGSACGLGDTTFEVGSKPEGASPYGALDLIGNVWEWTSSIREGSSSPVVRGGAFYVGPPHARASFGLQFNPAGRGAFVGFRCAK